MAKYEFSKEDQEHIAAAYARAKSDRVEVLLTETQLTQAVSDYVRGTLKICEGKALYDASLTVTESGVWIFTACKVKPS